MFSLRLGELLRSRKEKRLFLREVDALIRLHGVNAYNEARRRRLEAADLATAQYWGAVKSEIGRRIVEVCGDQAVLDSLSSKPFDGGASEHEMSDPSFENRKPHGQSSQTLREFYHAD